MILRQTRRACQIVCLKPPSQIMSDREIRSTASRHRKPGLRNLLRLNDGGQCEPTQTDNLRRSCRIHVLSANQELGK
jgi:hypothetical protein